MSQSWCKEIYSFLFQYHQTCSDLEVLLAHDIPIIRIKIDLIKIKVLVNQISKIYLVPIDGYYKDSNNKKY